MVQAGAFGTALPCTASHEGAGTVVSLAKAAEDRGFKVGQYVMCGIPMHPCGSCDNCLGPENQNQYCANSDGDIGVQLPLLCGVCQGGFSQHDTPTQRDQLPVCCPSCVCWPYRLPRCSTNRAQGGAMVRNRQFWWRVGALGNRPSILTLVFLGASHTDRAWYRV